MKKIVIDARGYATTTGRYVRKLIEYLEQLETGKSDREYVVLLFSSELNQYQSTNPRFSKQAADFAHYGISEQLGFLRFLNKQRADLVHFTMPQQPIFYRGKTVTTVHDLTLLKTYPGNRNKLLYKLKQLAGGYVFRQIANKSTHIITPSKFTKDEYLQFLGTQKFADKITVTYESADPSTASPSPYSALVDKNYIMYVGQQSNYKNLKRLVEAHQQLLTTHPSLHLALVGKLANSGLDLQKWVAQQNFKNIVFTGYMNDQQLAWVYKHCQAYIFPSLMEGFGLPGLEAMTYGTPVVSSNATSLPEVYGNAAHYFDPEDTDDIAQKISEVLNNKKLQEQLIKNASKRLRLYSWRRMAEQTLEIYKNSLDS